MTNKARVYDRHKVPHVRTLGTNDAEMVRECRAFLKWLRRKRRWDVLDLIIRRRLIVVDAWEAHENGTLAALVASASAEPAAPETDLSPLVAEWNGRGRKTTSAKYLRQVREMIPAGVPFPVSQFRKREVRKFLDGLTVADPTRNRYRAALSQFARWLVQREIIETNVVRDVDGYSEHDPRMIWMERPLAKNVVKALPLPFRALEAMMAGTGMEWQAVARVRAIDVNPTERTIFANGGKNRHRKRTVVVTEDWCWPIIEAHARQFTGPTPLFAGISEKAALLAHHAACAAAGGPVSTLHDWRHSYAIWNLTDGVEPAFIRPQLGHAPNSTVLERVYAAWIPTPMQRRKRAERAQTATISVTTPRKRVKR